VSFIDRDYLIEQIAPATFDPSFGDAILPGAFDRGSHRTYPKRSCDRWDFHSVVVRQNSVRIHFQRLGSLLFTGRLRYEPPMFSIIAVLTGTMLRVFRTRRNLLLENLVLRQQLSVLKLKRHRPWFAALDELFWVLARRLWSGWKQALIVVTPDTMVRWHRSGFALYWRVIPRARRVIGRRGFPLRCGISSSVW
jgi:hypothetical protein